MGLFGKKSAPVEPVTYDDTLAFQVGSVQNLRPNLEQIATRIGWTDRSQPSAAFSVTLNKDVDTYGHEAIGLYVDRLCVGFLPRSCNREMLPLLSQHPKMRGAMIMQMSGSVLTARCAPEVRNQQPPKVAAESS